MEIHSFGHIDWAPLEKPYIIDNEKVADWTVEVVFFDGDRELHRKEYALVEAKELYEKIRKGEPINLRHAFIKDFSLHTFKEEEGIAERDIVNMERFTATDCLFLGDKATNFSHAGVKKGPLDFSRSIFYKGDVSFYRADFSDDDCVFAETFFKVTELNFQFANFGTGVVDFTGSRFECDQVSFVNTLFGDGNVIFKEADFTSSNLNFHFARFKEGNISFDKAIFGGNVDFRKVEFDNGKFDFRRVTFGDGNLDFDEAEFKKGKISFKSTEFGNGEKSFHLVDFGKGSVSFEKVDFGQGPLDFSSVQAEALIFRGSYFNNHVDLRVADVQKIDLSDTVVRDIIDVNPFGASVDIGTLNVSGMRNMGRIFIDWYGNNVPQLIGDQDKTSLRDKASQFNLLKNDFNTNGEYDNEDRAYVWFKRYESRARLEEMKAGKGWQKASAYPLFWFKELVFDKMGLYATNPVRVFTSMLVFYIIFSLLYVVIPFISNATVTCPDDNMSFLHTVANAFYYSAITFLTVGYGDCLPTGVLKWVAPAEGWMGMFLMAYFTVAFVRKILR